MKEKLHTFLESGILERYLVGDTSIAENLEVEHQIDTIPEVAAAYAEMQNNLEILAKVNAVEPPLGVLNSILKETQTTPKVVVMPKQKTPWYSIAASIAAFIFAGTTLYFYLKNERLSNENEVVVDEIFDLRDDISKNNSKLDALAIQLQKLNNPNAQKYVLRGNERAKNLETVAYINPVDKTSMIDIISLPKLPDNQYYELRAELEDKMVSLGYLEDFERSFNPIPYMEDAVSLSISINNKKKDSSDIINQEVAEIFLKNN